MRGTFTGLLVAGTVLATFAFASGDRAGASGVQCDPGSGTWSLPGGRPGSVSDIPCEEPKPGWVFDWNNPGRIQFVYDGDRVVTPVVSATKEVATVVREVQEQGITRSIEGWSALRISLRQPLAEGEEAAYYADDDNRAVRAADGHCYREQRINGQWRRSASYGTYADACRQASWNAYHRSRGQRLIVPIGPYPPGWPE
ncbi:MAG: hypothetical protein OXH07_07515 [Chloroflexi bacterium]|nr:hypothetical protein [Chloroflexota bacterium]